MTINITNKWSDKLSVGKCWYERTFIILINVYNPFNYGLLNY